MEYTDEQRAAIEHFTGPLCLIACAGSGKTSTIVGRIVCLIRDRGVPPEHILAVTFTRAAAQEMRNRVAESIGKSDARKLTIRTFHGLAYQILRERVGRVEVLTEEDVQRALRRIMREMKLRTEQASVQNMATDISRFRGSGVKLEDYRPVSCFLDQFRKVLERYEEVKRDARKRDYDDLLEEVVQLIDKHPREKASLSERWPFILVDEFQDTNVLQFELLKRLIGPQQNIQVVGDDDQAIYAWRGSEVRFILEFPRRFAGCKVLHLSTNFRTTGAILAPASRLIAHNKTRFEKRLTAARVGGRPPIVVRPATMRAEDDDILALLNEAKVQNEALSGYAVLYRTNSQAFALAARLDKAGIPYRLLGSSADPFSGWAARDVLAYLSWAWDEASLEDMARVLKHPYRDGISKSFVEEFQASVHSRSEAWRWLERNASAAGRESLRKLQHGLGLLRGTPAASAIRFIRKQLDYDSYVISYCNFSGADRGEVFETLENIENMPEAHESSHAYIELARMMRAKKKREDTGETVGVTLSTFHSAKGLEWRTVYIKGAIEGYAPHKRALLSSDPADLEEERRLFYVAMTRAKDRLIISAPQTQDDAKVAPSRFLREAGLLADGRDQGNVQVRGRLTPDQVGEVSGRRKAESSAVDVRGTGASAVLDLTSTHDLKIMNGKQYFIPRDRDGRWIRHPSLRGTLLVSYDGVLYRQCEEVGPVEALEVLARILNEQQWSSR